MTRNRTNPKSGYPLGDQNPKSHLPPPASPISTRVRLELQAPANSHPEVIIVDPRRYSMELYDAESVHPDTLITGLRTEQGWRVTLEIDDGRWTMDDQKHRPSSIVHRLWSTEILLPQEPTILRYHFVLRDGTVIRERRQREGVIKPVFGVWEEHDFRIAVYDPGSVPPAWVQGSVFYQIFPDRFAVGGSRFQVPSSRFLEHGKTSNTERGTWNPEPGTRNSVYGRPAIHKGWDELPENPPKSRDFYGGNLRGVIEKLDYLQELGVTCIYFTPIFHSPSNHRYDAIDYFRVDPMLGTDEDLRELIARAGERGMRVLLDGVFNHCSHDSIYFQAAKESKQSPYYRWFTFTKWPRQYEGWLGVKSMPEFTECPEVEEFFFGEGGVAQHWLSYGTAGWRTDVTPWLTDEFWRRFRRAVRRSFPDAYLVSEDWGDATHRLLGDTFDATMNYRLGYSIVGFAQGKLTPAELDDRLETLRRDTPPPQFHAQMNLLDSHDTARLLTQVDGDKRRLMLAVALQFAYPGVPQVYSGSETGVEGTFAEDGRRPFPWGKEDRELLEFHKRVIHARRASRALSFGDVETVWVDERGGYGFVRRFEGEAVVALFNNGDEVLEAAIPPGEGIPDGEWAGLLDGEEARCTAGILRTTIPPLSFGWYRTP